MRRNPSLGARASLLAPQMGTALERGVAVSFYKAILACGTNSAHCFVLLCFFLIETFGGNSICSDATRMCLHRPLSAEMGI